MKSWNRWCNNASQSDGVELVRPGDIDHGQYRQAGEGVFAANPPNKNHKTLFWLICAKNAALFKR
ncbi:hypothetical protein OIL21_14480, partial [Salmonella enterica subsp. enterica serovar Agona]|nr:hypothetical protein [Salmonella enterica subsp. enterica serovar Agona]